MGLLDFIAKNVFGIRDDEDAIRNISDRALTPEEYYNEYISGFVESESKSIEEDWKDIRGREECSIYYPDVSKLNSDLEEYMYLTCPEGAVDLSYLYWETLDDKYTRSGDLKNDIMIFLEAIYKHEVHRHLTGSNIIALERLVKEKQTLIDYYNTDNTDAWNL